MENIDLPKKYSLPMRLMHWLMAILILGMIGAGWYMTGLEKDNQLRGTMYVLH